MANADDAIRYVVTGPAIIAKDFGDEAIVANLDTGLFYSLSQSGSAVWTGLASGRTLTEIVTTLAGADNMNASVVVAHFIGELIAEGLLKPGEARVDTMWEPRVDAEFQAPTIEKFDDLQALLLIDPIHDVGEQGWPVVAPAR
jgi:hypothetical protein